MKRGFTLVELLVTVAIVALLAAILWPVFVQARRQGYKGDCVSRIRQLSLACRMYYEDHERTPILQDPNDTGSVWAWAVLPDGEPAPPLAEALAPYTGGHAPARHLLDCAQPRGWRGYQQDREARPMTLIVNDGSHPGPMLVCDLMR